VASDVRHLDSLVPWPNQPESPAMLDHAALERLVYLYAEAVDEGRFADLAALFGRGRLEIVDLEGRELASAQGNQAVEAFFRSHVRTYDGRPLVRHVVTNMIVDSDGDEASARATFTVFQALSDFPFQPITGGRYYWRFMRAQAGWNVTELKIVVEFAGDGSRHHELD
jgi:3-phenylpropionate/cinnamic acid dioxygenase small subunit